MRLFIIILLKYEIEIPSLSWKPGKFFANLSSNLRGFGLPLLLPEPYFQFLTAVRIARKQGVDDNPWATGKP